MFLAKITLCYQEANDILDLMNQPLVFSITHRLPGTLARTGTIETPHGTIQTPAFIVGGTKARSESTR